MGMLRELPFGARISDSFVTKLKWETAQANEESPGALPCLCVQERQRYEALDRIGSRENRIDFEKSREVTLTNRLAPPTPPRVRLIKERAWVLLFDRRKHPPQATFEIDGVEVHISERAQAELKGATISVMNDQVVVRYETI